MSFLVASFLAEALDKKQEQEPLSPMRAALRGNNIITQAISPASVHRDSNINNNKPALGLTGNKPKNPGLG